MITNIDTLVRITAVFVCRMTVKSSRYVFVKIATELADLQSVTRDIKLVPKAAAYHASKYTNARPVTNSWNDTR